MTQIIDRQRVVFDVKSLGLRKRLKIKAAELDITLGKLVLEALADKHDDLAPYIIEELSAGTSSSSNI